MLCTGFHNYHALFREGFIIITDPYPEATGIYDPLLQLSCLDSSLAMKPVLERFQSVIVTSGTISPLFLYPKLLNFEPAVTQSFPMSLDRDCICPLIISKGPDQVSSTCAFMHTVYRYVDQHNLRARTLVDRYTYIPVPLLSASMS